MLKNQLKEFKHHIVDFKQEGENHKRGPVQQWIHHDLELGEHLRDSSSNQVWTNED